VASATPNLLTPLSSNSNVIEMSLAKKGSVIIVNLAILSLANRSQF